MTIRNHIDARALNARLTNLEACAEDAPEGAYETVKAFAGSGGFYTDLHLFCREALKPLGLRIPNDDRWREVEAVILGAIEAASDGVGEFESAAGFGEIMRTADDPVKARVIAQMERDVAFIAAQKDHQEKLAAPHNTLIRADGGVGALPTYATPKEPFVDYAQVERETPGLYDGKIPNAEDAAKVTTGVLVKISTAGEHFWVEVLEAHNHNGFYIGRVDNILAFDAKHGLKFNDRVFFEPRHIRQIGGVASTSAA